MKVFIPLKPHLLMLFKPFFVWQDKVLKKIDPEQVICLAAEKNYTRIFLSDKTYYMVRATLSNTLKKLPPDLFIKVHRSYAVSILFIDNIDKDHLTIGDEPIPIGKQYYKPVIEQLNIIE